MTYESRDRPVLSSADRALLKSAAAPTDAQLEATRRALGTRLAALAAGAAVAQAASTAEATGAAVGSAAATTATNGLATLGAAKWISAGLIVTAVAGGTVVATRRPPEPARASAARVAAPAQRAAAAPSVIAPNVAQAEQALPATDAPVEARSVPATRRSSVKSARRAASEPKPARALQGETLTAELALIHSARQALGRGDASAALQALDSHGVRFPNAVLQQEALSARALALCALGKPADARRAAAQLTRLAPRSPHLIRLADSCAVEDADPSP